MVWPKTVFYIIWVDRVGQSHFNMWQDNKLDLIYGSSLRHFFPGFVVSDTPKC